MTTTLPPAPEKISIGARTRRASPEIINAFASPERFCAMKDGAGFRVQGLGFESLGVRWLIPAQSLGCRVRGRSD
eukprot:3332683-Rhodomonas_salina.8